MEKRFNSIEQRLVFIEDVITRHTKEIQGMQATLKAVQVTLNQHSKSL